MLDIAERWKAEKIDLRHVKQFLLHYCSGATIAACDDNNYEGLFRAIVNEKGPVSHMLLEEIAKKFHSNATVHLIAQYRSMLESATPQYNPAAKSDVWLRLGTKVSYPMKTSEATSEQSQYRLTPKTASQYNAYGWATPEAMPSQYRSTPAVVSEHGERSPKLKKAKLCSYEQSSQM